MEIQTFSKGLKDGIPIGLGYLSVSFTFGMMAIQNGIPLSLAVATSLLNLTSAGQFAGLAMMVEQAPYFELILSQFIINLRYALMSLSLSQKLSIKIKTSSRVIMAFGITDEIFALAISQKEEIQKNYYYGLMCLPILCWTFGTLLGGVAYDLLPTDIQQALSIAIYGMFIAIIIPPAKINSNIRIVVIFSILCSCILNYIAQYISISNGMIIIITAILVAGIAAIVLPIKENQDE